MAKPEIPSMSTAKAYYPSARFLKIHNRNRGGISGLFRRAWYNFLANLMGFKWILVEFFSKHNKLNPEEYKKSGQVAVITGGGRGIGLQIVKKLLQADIKIIVGVRNVQATTESINKIIEKNQITTGSFEVLRLDLMSFSSVREFADEILLKDCQIHLLINNAGIMMTPYYVTPNEQESQFQVNHLSHFLLTCKLLPKLIESGLLSQHTRIINVSSIAHYFGKINFDDLQMFKFYSSSKAYMDSKLAQIVFTNYLNNFVIHGQQDLNVNVYSVHPGVILTDLYSHVFFTKIFGCLLKPFLKSIDEGADGIVYAALSPEMENKTGIFLANCKIYPVNRLANDIKIQKQLWDISLKIVGLNKSDLDFLDSQLEVMELNEDHKNVNEEKEKFQIIDMNSAED